MEELEKTESLLRVHLTSSATPLTEPTWKLSQSPHGGRGVFAARDLDLGVLLFVDPPLVLGPRAGAHCLPMCVGCYMSGGELVPCTGGCGLPVCGRHCETSAAHRLECEFLASWRCTEGGQETTWSSRLLRAVTAIRCLGLNSDQRRLVRHLQTHRGSQHEQEVEWIKQSVEVRLSEDDEEFMRTCCQAMDANAFEVEITQDTLSSKRSSHVKSPSKLPESQSIQLEMSPLPVSRDGEPPKDAILPQLDPSATRPHPRENKQTPQDSNHTDSVKSSSKTSLRGLYPLSAMMNHACTPNTRHGYDAEHRMIVRATSAIPQGTEITTSYSALLWGTPVRRHHLASTKHFLCTCNRCRDPQEGGTRLAALRCAKRECLGSLLPVDPVKAGTRWTCDVCGLLMPDKQARLIQAALGQLLSSVANGGPEPIASFLREHRGVTSTSNQLVVEMKSNLVWILGHRQGHQYPDLSEGDLETKIMLCRELLLLLETLGAGQCRMRGLLLYELRESLLEKRRRSIEMSEEEEAEIVSTLEEVLDMFVDDVTSPAAHAH